MKHNLSQPLENSGLFEQQQKLNFILENAIDYNEAKRLLQTSTLSNSDWEIEHWNPMMLETVLKIAKKWKS
jgi:hypothetical protein